MRPAPPSPHRPSTARRITVDNILWAASHGSRPRDIKAPCLTLAEAIALNLLPHDAVVPTDTTLCICYNLVSGHPVICMSFKGGGPAPPSIQMNGTPTTDPTSDNWPSQRITDELSAGYIGATLDCFAQADPETQAALMQALDDVLHFRERAESLPRAAPLTTDTEETSTDEAELRAACEDRIAEAEARGDTPEPCPPPPPGPPPLDDRDPDTQALYDALKGLVCDLLGWLYDPSCDTTSGDLPETLQAALVLAEFCQHTLLDDVLAKLARCAALLPPLPPILPDTTTPDTTDATCTIARSSCLLPTGLVQICWDHTPTLDEILAWGAANCRGPD